MLGPSKDGGYYLIGLRSFHPRILEEIDWSTEKVLDQTLERAKELNWKVSLLEELNVIDDIDDLRRSTVTGTFGL